MSDCPTPTKTEYASRRAAKRALHSIRSPQGRMKAYPCVGGHWHLGHTNDLANGRPPTPKRHGPRLLQHAPAEAPFIIAGNHQVVVGGVCLSITAGALPDRVGGSLEDNLRARGLPADLVDDLVASNDVNTAVALVYADSAATDAITKAWTDHKAAQRAAGAAAAQVAYPVADRPNNEGA